MGSPNSELISVFRMDSPSYEITESIGDLTAGSELQEMFKDLRAKIQRKQDALRQAEEEYAKLCQKIEDNIKDAGNINKRKYILENHLQSCEVKLEQYGKIGKTIEDDINAKKINIESLNNQILEEEKALDDNDRLFNQNVIDMANKVCHEHEVYEHSAVEGEIESLQQSTYAVSQELNEVRLDLEELVSQNPFIDPKDSEYVRNACLNAKSMIESQARLLKTQNRQKENQLLLCEKNKRALEFEIQQLKAQHGG